MSRALKTKFPCRLCGVPAEVERLRDAKRAECDACAERQQILSRFNTLNSIARRTAAVANSGADADEGGRFVARWIHSCVLSLEAAAVATKGAQRFSPRDKRRLLLNARKLCAHVVRSLDTLDGEWFDGLVAEAGGVELLAGEAEPAVEVRPAPSLRLVREDA